MIECNPANLYPSSNLGFGFCMAGGRDKYVCDDALGERNTGFGLCMLNSDRYSYQCDDALGGDNVGFGLCMFNNDRYSYQCDDALGSNNIGFGICMLDNNRYSYQCDDSLGGNNIGFGLCMLNSDRYSYQCDDSLGGNNTGFGLCMLNSDRYSYQCDDAIGAENTYFGQCMLSSEPSYLCDDLLFKNKSDFAVTIEGTSYSSINGKTFKQNNSISIELALNVPREEIGKIADIYVAVKYRDINGKIKLLQKSDQGFSDWDGKTSSLKPFQEDVVLKEFRYFDVFSGRLEGLPGTYELYWGYVKVGAPSSELVYNKNRSFKFTVN
ncbi:MAG: hypothetical protein R3B45_16615 [Bdellovibrionota bacterium]